MLSIEALAEIDMFLGERVTIHITGERKKEHIAVKPEYQTFNRLILHLIRVKKNIGWHHPSVLKNFMIPGTHFAGRIKPVFLFFSSGVK